MKKYLKFKCIKKVWIYKKYLKFHRIKKVWILGLWKNIYSSIVLITKKRCSLTVDTLLPLFPGIQREGVNFELIPSGKTEPYTIVSAFRASSVGRVR